MLEQLHPLLKKNITEQPETLLYHWKHIPGCMGSHLHYGDIRKIYSKTRKCSGGSVTKVFLTTLFRGSSHWLWSDDPPHWSRHHQNWQLKVERKQFTSNGVHVNANTVTLDLNLSQPKKQDWQASFNNVNTFVIIKAQKAMLTYHDLQRYLNMYKSHLNASTYMLLKCLLH